MAVEFAKKQKSLLTGENLNRSVIGFDIDYKRIEELERGFDRTNEISKSQILSVSSLDLTSDIKKLIAADIFIITVPTPIDENKPDLRALKNASKTVAKVLKLKRQAKHNSRDIVIPVVIYEITVYPELRKKFVYL